MLSQIFKNFNEGVSQTATSRLEPAKVFLITWFVQFLKLFIKYEI